VQSKAYVRIVSELFIVGESHFLDNFARETRAAGTRHFAGKTCGDGEPKHRNYIGVLERGGQSPSLAAIVKLAHALPIPPLLILIKPDPIPNIIRDALFT
jgi:hypothetical protein